jgi:hypothetical protein
LLQTPTCLADFVHVFPNRMRLRAGLDSRETSGK